MKIGEACAIFKDIYRRDKTDDEKLDAIDTVLGMATHNGITKADFLNVVMWQRGYRWEDADN